MTNALEAGQRGPLEQRVETLEGRMSDLHGEIARLAEDIDKLRSAGAPRAPIEQKPTAEVAAQETPVAAPIYCTRCKAANPPLAERCQWCGSPFNAQESTSTPVGSRTVPLPAAWPAYTEPGKESQTVQTPIGAPANPQPAQRAGGRAPRRPVTAPSSPLDLMKNMEFWLNKVGIVLFLFGVAFLFKYAIDKGWLTEQVRIVCGLALGTGLLGFGLGLHKSRPGLSQVLLGGSVVTYYITAYASYMLFTDLHIPFEVAFDFMGGVTLMALILSMVFGRVSLSLVGVTGGLLTPFVLNNRLDLPLLVAYTCLVLALAADAYLMRGWRSVLWVSYVGGWLVMLYAFNAANLFAFAAPRMEDRWALQAGLAFMLVAFWALPVFREVLSYRNPARWNFPDLKPGIDPGIQRLADRQAWALTVFTPALVYGLSWAVWGNLVSQEAWGLFGLAGGALFGLVFFGLRKIDEMLAYVHMVVGAGLVTVGLAAVLGQHPDVLLVALSVEAAALIVLGHRYSDRVATCIGEVLYVPVAAFMLYRLSEYAQNGVPLLNPAALTDLAALALAFGASFFAWPKEMGYFLRGGAHAGVILLIWHEFHSLDKGYDAVVFGWAVYAVLLRVAAVARAGERTADREESDTVAHLVFAVAGVSLLVRIVGGLLLTNPDGIPFFNTGGLLDFGVILAGAVALWLALARGDRDDRRIVLAYALWLHFAFVGWLWQEIGLLESGNGWVSIAWGVYALALLGVWVFVRRNPLYFYLGTSTLFAISAKLFLIDVVMYHLPTEWRILLFLGFGTLFLLLSYFFGGTIKLMLSDDSSPGKEREIEAPCQPQ